MVDMLLGLQNRVIMMKKFHCSQTRKSLVLKGSMLFNTSLVEEEMNLVGEKVNLVGKKVNLVGEKVTLVVEMLPSL